MDSIPQSPLKRCSKCKVEKPISEFRREHKSKDGMRSACKSCCNVVEAAWRERNSDRVKINNKRYNENNREAVAKKKRDWSLRNAERVRAKAKAYRAAKLEYLRAYRKSLYWQNPEAAREATRQWKIQNPDKAKQTQRSTYLKHRITRQQKIKVYRQQWEKQNPDKVRAKNHKRRARKAANGGVHTADDIQLAYKSQRGKCWHCGVGLGDVYHADHLIPLARGGSNDARNIVLSCPDCNMRKGAKLPQEWNGRLF